MATASDAALASLQPIVSSKDHSSHVVQFYSDESYLLDELSRFIGTALMGGDVAIVIATDVHREGLAKRLTARGFDLSRALQWGRYVPLDASETLAKFVINGLPDPDKFHNYLAEIIERAARAGESESPRIFAFGEMVALLWAQGNPAGAIRVEQLWNELAKARSFQLRCAYPISHFGKQEHAEAFLQICGEHSGVIPGESYTNLSSEQERLRIISQLQQKAQALENEVAERNRIQEQLIESQEALRKSHEELESRVSSRTEDLANAEIRLRQLSRTLLNLRDEERRRLARELHDSTGQTLAALGLNLVMMQKADLGPEISDKLAESLQLADHALQEIRNISYLLHPPMLDEAGLALALEWYVEGFAERSRMQIDLELPPDYERLPQETELAIFRIVQESLTNVYRHSGSTSARVRLTMDAQQIQLSIEDAGRGIPRQKIDAVAGSYSGVGLRGMRERARHLGGDLEITPADPGTCIRVTLPIRKRHLAPRKVAHERSERS